MQASEVDAFVDDLGMNLALEAPDELRNAIMLDDKLGAAVLSFQQEAKEGLRAVLEGKSTAAGYEARLRVKKTNVIAAAPSHAFTLERLVAKALAGLVAKARGE